MIPSLTRQRQKVRIHFPDNRPSIEGFLIGRANGHYHIAIPEILESADRTVELDSREVAIPSGQVWFYEVLR